MFRPAPWLALHESLGLEPPPPFDDRQLAAHNSLPAPRQPQTTALQFRALAITYRALDELASRFANALKGAGIGKGDAVGIHLPNIPQYPVSYTHLTLPTSDLV